MPQQDTQTLETTTVSTPISQHLAQQTRDTSPQVDTGSPQKAYQAKKAIFHAYQVVWYILGVIEVLLAFRILFKILGASTQSGFTSFIYAVSNPFALPFAGIFGVTGTATMVLEWSTLVAMAVYAIIAYGIVTLFQLIKPTNQDEVERTVDNQQTA